MGLINWLKACLYLESLKTNTDRFEELLKIYIIPKTFEDKEKSYYDYSKSLEFHMNEVHLNIKPCESLFNKLSTPRCSKVLVYDWSGG